jgi:2-polyprenyl-3-methyl-5-hydroxy-6-metoxy-1,4-benzoquinol methylase
VSGPDSLLLAQGQESVTDKVWPNTDLEFVETCPVCGCPVRTRLHGGLKDWTFRCAPGEWSLWTCAACESGYLDPRPSQASVGRAYASYYTHSAQVAPCDYESLSALRRLRRVLANGYVAWRYGHSTPEPASKLGVVAALFLPSLKTNLDYKYRNLPRPSALKSALLDVGCGDGNFLQLAAASGWQTLGVDFDGAAVARARERGLVVLEGGVEALTSRHDEFDVITMSHVIEHAHDPLYMLEACYRLLKPGGCLWIETPNILSYSHARFGRFWRGLEAPRHLVMFNDESLRSIISRAGFVAVEPLRRPSAFRSLYFSSQTIQSAVVGKCLVPSVWLKIEAAVSTLRAIAMPHRREHLTMIARKPICNPAGTKQ